MTLQNLIDEAYSRLDKPENLVLLEILKDGRPFAFTHNFRVVGEYLNLYAPVSSFRLDTEVTQNSFGTLTFRKNGNLYEISLMQISELKEKTNDNN